MLRLQVMTPRPLRRRALVVVGAAAVLPLAGCTGGGPTLSATSASPAPTTSSSSSSSSTPSPSPSATPTPSTSAPSTSPVPSASPPLVRATTAARTVFWLGPDAPGGPRLYRETVARPLVPGVVADAVRTMLETRPVDPDYRSLWPRGTRLLGASLAGTVATVDLSPAALAAGASPAQERASLQQLVATVRAAAPTVTAVQLHVGGRAVETLWGSVDTRGPLRPGPSYEVLAPVQLLTPADGATVRRGSRVGGEATVFEATVSWEWVAGGRVVARGSSNATEGAPGRGTWSAPVTVPAGRYVLRAYEASAEDGSRRWVDTKTVTVA